MYTIYYPDFSNNFKSIREFLSLSIVDVSEILSISPSIVKRYEDGSMQPKAGDIYKLCNKYGLDYDIFFEQK